MRLRELDARFIRREIRVETRGRIKPAALALKPDGPWTDEDIEQYVGPCEFHPFVDELADADGVLFLCPKCYAANGGEVGTHAVICWFVGKVPPEAEPKPGRWTPRGTGLDDLTFVPSAGRSNSVLLIGGCEWHGFVKNGGAA